MTKKQKKEDYEPILDYAERRLATSKNTESVVIVIDYMYMHQDVMARIIDAPKTVVEYPNLHILFQILASLKESYGSYRFKNAEIASLMSHDAVQRNFAQIDADGDTEYSKALCAALWGNPIYHALIQDNPEEYALLIETLDRHGVIPSDHPFFDKELSQTVQKPASKTGLLERILDYF